MMQQNKIIKKAGIARIQKQKNIRVKINFIDKTKVFTLILLLMIIAVILTSCKTVTQQEAESTAQKFIQQRVKFFVKNDSSTIGKYDYNMLMETAKQGNEWNILTHISTLVGNETKKKDVQIRIDAKSGKIEAFESK